MENFEKNITSILHRKFFMLISGALLFWLPFLILVYGTGKEYSGRHVLFLTFFVPIFMTIVALQYRTLLNKYNLPFKSYCFLLIGFIGPLIPCLLFFIPMVFQTVRKKGIVEGVKTLLFIPLGIMPILTYSGMLGAMVINIIFSVLSLIIKDKLKTI